MIFHKFKMISNAIFLPLDYNNLMYLLMPTIAMPNLILMQRILFYLFFRYPTSGNLVIHLSKVTINPLYFVLRNIYNPMIDSSSFFGLCIRSDTHNL